MSVVVYRDGIIAADMSSWHGQFRNGTVNKISRHPNGLLFGGIGDLWRVSNFLNMAKTVDPLNVSIDISDTTGLMVDRDGRITLFEGTGKTFVLDRYFAIGSGSPVALGALDAGATAIMAAKIACDRSEGVGYPIEAMDHSGKRWIVAHASAPEVEQRA